MGFIYQIGVWCPRAKFYLKSRLPIDKRTLKVLCFDQFVKGPVYSTMVLEDEWFLKGDVL